MGLMDLRGQGQGCGQVKEICTGPRLRALVSTPEHVNPHLHACGQLLRVDMPAQDLTGATVSRGEHSLTQSTHLALHPQMGVTVCLSLLQKVTGALLHWQGTSETRLLNSACKAPPTLRTCCGETQGQPLSLPTRL